MPTKTQWDLTPMATTDTTDISVALAGLDAKVEAFVKTWKPRKDYLTNPQVLAQALVEYESLVELLSGVSGVGYYFGLRKAQDQTNKQIETKNNQIHALWVEATNKLLFFELTLAKKIKTKSELLASPHLAPYKHYLERLFGLAKYTLSEKEERIINLMSKPAYDDWVSLVSEFLDREECVTLDEHNTPQTKNFNQLFALMNNKSKAIRDAAVQKFNAILVKHSDLAEKELNAVLYTKKVGATLRKYKRADLGQHLADDIDSKVVDTLLAQVKKNFKVAHRYYALKAKLLGVPQLAYHERNISLYEGTTQFS